MDMSEVKSFNAELSGLYDNKPPISKAKMSAITKGAIKAIKFYKHVVHSVEKFIQKCKPEYKVPGLYVIDSIVRQSRHQFGQEKDVFAPRFAKNMQQTFANLFRCPPEDKRNIIRVLNLWQKNNVFTSSVIQPLLDMADPNHPLHQEIQQQNNNANGSSLNLSHNTSDNKISPGPSSQHSPRMSSPMDGNQFQDEPSGPPNMKFNRKLLNDFEYESEDEPMILDPPLPASTHSSHSHSHTSHSHHTGHTSHASHTSQQQTNPTDAMASILTNPEIMRQLQSLQAQMSLMTGMQIPNLMPMMSDMQLQQNQNQQGLPFLSNSEQQNDGKDDMANESDIEFVDAGPQVIEIPDANDSRSPSPRRRRSRSKSPRRRARRDRTRSRSPRRRRDRDRDREKERDREKGKDYKEREADREKQKEREKKGLPPIKKENLSVCSTTLWVGHLSKLATPEELSDLFGGIGGVVSIDVVAPRGCAFVVMERRRDAYKALMKLNKHKLHSKEITVAWAPGKGVKGREWKEQWEAELGVSYLPWAALHARWALGDLQLDALEDGGAVDEDTLPPWLPPRIMPKSMLENLSLLGLPPGMISLPPGLPPPLRPQLPPEMAAAALGSPANLAVTRMPPPGMSGGLPPGMPPGLPPGLRPAMPGAVPGMPGDGGMPPAGAMIRFPPGMPPQGMGQPGMVPGFLPGLLGVGGMGNMGMPNMPMFAPVIPQHAPPALPIPPRANDANDDDAMDLDTEDMHHDEPNGESTENLPPALLPDQIQALLSKPPPKFNASEPPPGFNVSEPPPFSQPPPDDKQDDDRKSDRDRDRRERDRGERDRRGDRRDRDRDRRNERGNERGNDRVNDRRERGNERDRDGGRDDRRDRDRGRDRRDRDRDRDRGPPPRDNNGERGRDKSPRSEGGEKSLQERLWEMANGKPAARDDKTRDERDESRDLPERRPDTDGAAGPGPGVEPAWGPPRPPFPPGGPWMDGPPGPPFGPRFNGLGPPPFPPRPPFERPPFEMPPRFDRPPFRMPFDMQRPPFDGPRPPFDGMRPPFAPRPGFDGPPFDGPDMFDRGRRFDDREFGDRNWERREWDERRRGRDERPRRDERRRNYDDKREERPREERPREERPKEDRPERKEEERPERRKSRWGEQAEDEPEPVRISDELKQKLQDTIARFPQSESDVQPTEPAQEKSQADERPEAERPAEEPEAEYPQPKAPEAEREPQTESRPEPDQKDLEPRVSETQPESDKVVQEAFEPPNESPKQSYESPKQSYESPKQSYESPKQSYESPKQSYESPKQSYESESTERSYEPEPVQKEMEEAMPSDLYDSATDVGIDTSFADPIPEEIVEKPREKTPETTDDIFQKESSDSTDSKGA